MMVPASPADVAAVLSGIGSFGMLTYMLVSQIPKNRKERDDEIAHRARIEDEILGRAESQGLPRIPSLSERLTTQDKAIGQIQEVIRQLKPNGGSSLADRIGRIEEKLDSAKVRLDGETQAQPRQNPRRRRPPDAPR